jgi:heme/copper-type cytochrome/quinol oxidase subunit 4
MNEMELLRQMAKETPLPAPAELDAARARLVAAIATDPGISAAAVAEATTSQPHPSTGQPAGPVRPPAPVRTAAKFMHAGAIGTAAGLIVLLAFSWDTGLYHLTLAGHHYTTAQLSHLRPLLITVAAAVGLALIALWLWMARAASQGKNWARILSTVLFGLATLQLIGNHGAVQVFYAVLTWLTGLPAVWLLWRPASSVYFNSAKPLRSQPPSQISGP